MRTQRKPRLTPFERETLRRRTEMLRNIAGRISKPTGAFLRSLPRRQRLYMMQKPEKQA